MVHLCILVLQMHPYGHATRVTPSQVPLVFDGSSGQWVMDFEAMEAKVTPRTKMFLLCNPHNPVRARILPRVFNHRRRPCAKFLIEAPSGVLRRLAFWSQPWLL
jgi:hypothetical protein